MPGKDRPGRPFLRRPAELAQDIERYVEEHLEGRLRRWLKAPLQPVEVCKAVARSMEASLAVSGRGLRAANLYQVHLNPADYERFASYRLALAREIEAYVAEQAERLDARPVDRWQIHLVADEQVPLGRVVVRSAMVDIPAEPGSSAAEGTTRLAALGPSLPVAALIVGEQRYRLGGPVIRIGRALDNDIVLADERVSRYHASIRLEDGRYRLIDLASTNGTYIGGQRVSEALLDHGDEISFGGLVVRFEQGQ